MLEVRATEDGHIFVSDLEKKLRYSLTPGSDLTGQPAEVVRAAESAWTEDVVAAFRSAAAAAAS